MAQSRLEKIGTIYTRVSSLIKSGAIKSEDKPFWCLIYEAFPPKYEPSYDRRPPDNITMRNIFYTEDIIRAKFHKDVQNLPMIDLKKMNVPSPTQKFLAVYNRYLEDGVPSSTAYDRALEDYKAEHKITKPEQNQHNTESVTSQLTNKTV